MNNEEEVTFQSIVEMLAKMEQQHTSEKSALVSEYEWLRDQMIRGIKAIRLAELHFDAHADRLWRKELPDIDAWLEEMETATMISGEDG